MHSVTALITLGLSLLGRLSTQAQSAPSPPLGAMHQRLQALAGTCSVKKYIYTAGGTPAKPLVGTLTCRRTWIAGGRFLQDIMVGPLPALPGGQYYRMGGFGDFIFIIRSTRVTGDWPTSFQKDCVRTRGWLLIES